MGDKTTISWCHHTHNRWWGCEKISPGCTNCYASAFDRRLGGDHWKVGGPRRFFGDAHLNEPLKWNRLAEAAGERRRVFCGSMMDIMESHPDPAVAELQDEARDSLWALIRKTPWLDWLLLTKRPENFWTYLPWLQVNGYTHADHERARDLARPWSNVWLGVTTENQEQADRRLRILRTVPAAVYYASYEPALEGVDFAEHVDLLDWIIFGDESGVRRRPAEIGWARSTRDQCKAAGVAFHFKQWCGEIPEGVAGERVKGKIHLPVLDGSQHASFPEVRS